MASPFKFCFRLEEPPEGRKEWRVNYLLQSFEDPSLIVSTEEIWNPKGIRREILNYPDFNLRQFVLMSLGMALGVCPEIKRSLEEQVPQGYFLDNQGAFEFLESQAGGLEELGFGLICPNWWNREKSSIAAKAFVKSPFSCSKQGSLWDDIQCEWAVYIGKLKFSLKELREIALLKSPLVKLRGQWMVLKEDQLSQAIAFLKKPYQPQSLIDLLQIDGGISDKKHGISIEGVESEGWVKEFLEALKSDQSLEVIEPPKGFQGRLRPYQQRGYSWMSFLQKWKIGALLADDMGLGKTPQTLALIMQGWEGQKKQKPSLLVCPTSLLGNWAREAEKFVPSLPIYVHHGSQRPKGEGFLSEAGKTGLVLTSYALLYRDLSLFKQCGWNGIILDEAQNIKNTETRQTQASYQLQGEYRLALTGTPVENNVGDLYSLMHFLNPGYLGTQQSFRQQFYKPIQIEHNPSVVQNLKRLTAPFILRRLKTDRSIISDLPDKIEQNSYCSLTKEQVSLYESVIEEVNALLEVSEGIARKGVILSTFSKLKQICNHPVNFLKDGSSIQSRSGKLLHLEELLGEIWAAQERTLIFTQYTEMGSLLVDYLEEKFGKEVIFLHGGVRKKDRDLMVKRFQEEESGPEVFILSIKAGGVGLNLTRANHVVHYDRWWNPAVENQATDRAFRIGQAKTVQVHKLVCMGTIEEKIDAMIKSKKEISESAVGVGEQWLTELSNETLQDLWKLQKDLALC
ncbi:MAG: DEAD/DEAH box helicase [Chlamydiia bacterium]|nr:DEAD/DEAH box helicase [Chlamydiia bacterium]